MRQYHADGGGSTPWAREGKAAAERLDAIGEAAQAPLQGCAADAVVCYLDLGPPPAAFRRIATRVAFAWRTMFVNASEQMNQTAAR